jgi:hypothetical protein
LTHLTLACTHSSLSGNFSNLQIARSADFYYFRSPFTSLIISLKKSSQWVRTFSRPQEGAAEVTCNIPLRAQPCPSSLPCHFLNTSLTCTSFCRYSDCHRLRAHRCTHQSHWRIYQLSHSKSDDSRGEYAHLFSTTPITNRIAFLLNCKG